jgi:long-chain acyl-CoA synthetase
MIGDLPLTDETTMDVFLRIVESGGGLPAIHYLDRTINWAEVDAATAKAAGGLRRLGVEHGDRVALMMQNVPEYPIMVLAAWRIGAVIVPVNPMFTAKDVRFLLADSGATVLVGHPELLDRAGEAVEDELGVTLVSVDPKRLAGNWPEQFFRPPDQDLPGATSWAELCGGDVAVNSLPAAEDVAVLTYTSGTTGPPKGAINTHRNVLFASQFYERWVELGRTDVILGLAPLFHITGLIAHMGPSFVTGSALVLGYRFDAGIVADLVERYRPTFAIGAITAFIALMDHEGSTERDFSSLTKVYSGGAPIAPTTVDDFQKAFGPYIHNIYGLTEATGPCLAVPLGSRAPVDSSSGALAAGVPVCNTEVRLVDSVGEDVGVGEPGEVAMRGPQVVPGYWNRSDETANAIRGGWLHTGDVAVRDEQGWYYIVDRIKDQINASGFKVWPREVEDVLVAHPAVSSAAVIGVPDSYRGETVKGFVVLRPGRVATEGELMEWAKKRLAAYKYPRQIEIVDDLPRNASGKILRRMLREG